MDAARWVGAHFSLPEVGAIRRRRQLSGLACFPENIFVLFASETIILLGASRDTQAGTECAFRGHVKLDYA